MRRFYVVYSQDKIRETLFPQFADYPALPTGERFYLSWSHYLKYQTVLPSKEELKRLIENQ